jgi:hypothetical protein
MPKSSARRATRVKRVRGPRRWTPGRDAVRIVPLHYPRPNLSVDQLAAAQQPTAPDDLYDGKPHLAPANVQLSYRGGPLLTSVQLYAVYWGTSWQSSAAAQALVTGMDRFFSDILVSPLLDQLGEYSVGAKKIGRGKFLGSSVRSEGAPSGGVTDAAVRKQLQRWLRAKAVPKAGAQSLYFIFLEPGVVSSMGGSKSCQNYCGYHDAAGAVYYALMPYPSCAGCLGGMAVLDALTATSSHELCEAITDPVPGTGWYDDTNGEIGDICAWQFRRQGAHMVQLEWSNAQRRCV